MLHLQGGYKSQNQIHKNPSSMISKINQKSMEARQPYFNILKIFKEGPKPDFSNHRASSGGGALLKSVMIRVAEEARLLYEREDLFKN